MSSNFNRPCLFAKFGTSELGHKVFFRGNGTGLRCMFFMSRKFELLVWNAPIISRFHSRGWNAKDLTYLRSRILSAPKSHRLRQRRQQTRALGAVTVPTWRRRTPLPRTPTTTRPGRPPTGPSQTYPRETWANESRNSAKWIERSGVWAWRKSWMSREDQRAVSCVWDG